MAKKISEMIAKALGGKTKSTAAGKARRLSLELASGEKKSGIAAGEIAACAQRVADGREDFMILSSDDGFFQFYGVGDRFVAEFRFNLKNGDFRTYSLIDPVKRSCTQRVKLTTPYGSFTPMERDIVTLQAVLRAAEQYAASADERAVVEALPCLDTTKETKKCMGIS